MQRRKLLTPTFHFKILEDFIFVFNEHCATLIEQLRQAIKDDKDLNMYPWITRCTLDIICGKYRRSTVCFLFPKLVLGIWIILFVSDSAMGINIKAQTQSESPYVKAVYA